MHSLRRGWSLVAMVAATVAEDGFSTGLRSSYSDLHHFDDAELFLSSVGVPSGLPMLEVKYTKGGWGQKYSVMASESHLSGADGVHVDKIPQIEWVAGTPAGAHERKFMLMMIDPDSPSRRGDGSAAGADGIKLKWFGVNCKEDAKSCHHFVPYSGPNPRADMGEHRYIIILFLQKKPPPSSSVLSDFVAGKSDNFDLPGFLSVMEGCMEPYAMNFFYYQRGAPPSPPPPPAPIETSPLPPTSLLPPTPTPMRSPPNPEAVESAQKGDLASPHRRTHSLGPGWEHTPSLDHDEL